MKHLNGKEVVFYNADGSICEDEIRINPYISHREVKGGVIINNSFNEYYVELKDGMYYEIVDMVFYKGNYYSANNLPLELKKKGKLE